MDTHQGLSESQHSSENGNWTNVLASENFVQQAVCALCHANYVANGDLESSNICGDCKFLLIEDFQNSVGEFHGRIRRRRISRRRTRYSSSESMESRFSRQFSQMLNRIRQNQSNPYMHEDNYSDGGTSTRLVHQTSTYDTPSPSGSRRWQRVFSDTESEAFENVGSTFGESESSVGLGRFCVFHGESDSVSISAYGWDSDTSVDGPSSVIDTEVFFHPDEASNLDSDTDIDPMHAGINHWSLGDQEDEGGEEGEWEETDAEEDLAESAEGYGQLGNAVMSSTTEGGDHTDSRQLFGFPELEGIIYWRIRGGRHIDRHEILANMDEMQLPFDSANSHDHLDGRSFEDLLEYLAESENFRRGAPPTANSFASSLPIIVVKEDTPKDDSLACAICKDVLTVGVEVNQLPCRHLYHPPCILPWLSLRNSCPLCRYELPTDDKDYEEAKQNGNGSMHVIHDNNGWRRYGEDDLSDAVEDDEEPVGRSTLEGWGTIDEHPHINSSSREGGRGRWLIFAAAPIVSLLGMALVFWLGNPLNARGRVANNRNFFEGQPHGPPVVGSSTSDRGEGRTRRWWFPF